MATAAREEALATVCVPLIILTIKTGSAKNTSDIGNKLIKDVFERYIFQTKMEKATKIGFLNLFETFCAWATNGNKDINDLRTIVEQLFAKLNKL